MYFTKGKFKADAEASKPFVYSSEHHRGNAAFITINIKGKVGKQIADYFGVEKEGVLLGATPLEGEEVAKYMYTGAWDNKDVHAWIQAYLDGKIERHLKSEAIPD